MLINPVFLFLSYFLIFLQKKQTVMKENFMVLLCGLSLISKY